MAVSKLRKEMLLPFGKRPLDYRRRRIRKYLVRLYLGVGLLVSAIAIGIIGYMVIDDFTFLDAFFMTIITLATIGYSEVKPLSDAGKVFTIFLIITNLGVFTYAISVVSALVIEGDVKNLWRYFSMHSKINQLQDHVVICGFGRYGREICDNFSRHGTPFVVIERQPALITYLHEQRYLCVEGDATHDRILEEANIAQAKTLICTLPDDADSVYVVLSARQMNENLNIISRATSPRSEAKLKRAGASEVVTPEKIGGFYVAALANKPDVIEFFKAISNESDAHISFEEVKFTDAAKSEQARRLADLKINEVSGAILIGLRHADGTYLINPPPETELQPNMCLIVLGNANQMERLKDWFEQYHYALTDENITA